MIVAPLIASLTPEALAALPEHRVAMLRYAWDLFARESQKPPPGDWTDITYIPMARGFLYLVAIMDWHSRYVLAWRLSNTLEVDFCVAALEEALSKGRPQIFNTDQGSPVHQRGLHQHAAGARRSSEHGRQGPVHGQRLRGTAVAQHQVRGGVPEGIPKWD